MKTTTDIAQFLKRTGCTLSLSFDDKDGRFLAHVNGDEAASKYLDDALENMAEAFRRRANSMEPIRDDGTGKAGDGDKTAVAASPPNITLPAWMTTVRHVYGNASQWPTLPPTAAPQINGIVPSCQACGKLPAYALNGGNISCSCGVAWVANTQDTYRFTNHTGSWKFDGKTWTKVAP